MLGIDLVRPLDESWREVLDAVGRAHGWPTSRDVAKLAARVAELSAAYNDSSRASARMKDAGAARLGFSFARDVPKGAAAVRELLAVGLLAARGPLRVLDLGAGLGAMTWGLLRARALAGTAGPVEATWVDGDGEALDLALEIARERAKRSPGSDALTVKAVKGSVDGATASTGDWQVGGGAFDVVVVGQVLSEIDIGSTDEPRAARQAAWLQVLLERHVAPGGSLVVVEPALRDRSRNLHRVRDAVVGAGATVFAPCTHREGCPALRDERDWCHEDLRVDLPPWLVPVARAAGLRYEGLTFSYLVLRRDGATLGRLAGSPAEKVYRVVSDRIRSKGKIELFLCGELEAAGGAHVAARARTVRLDRHATPGNVDWERLVRGDLVTVGPAPSLERPRIEEASHVRATGALGSLGEPRENQG
jgi:2-polyprenyl-3-methyl-5-hydroxy-6-metoxy-1,4-benzoquinol methylase